MDLMFYINATLSIKARSFKKGINASLLPDFQIIKRANLKNNRFNTSMELIETN